jgi:hypothetical protein
MPDIALQRTAPLFTLCLNNLHVVFVPLLTELGLLTTAINWRDDRLLGTDYALLVAIELPVYIDQSL